MHPVHERSHMNGSIPFIGMHAFTNFVHFLAVLLLPVSFLGVAVTLALTP